MLLLSYTALYDRACSRDLLSFPYVAVVACMSWFVDDENNSYISVVFLLFDFHAVLDTPALSRMFSSVFVMILLPI